MVIGEDVAALFAVGYSPVLADASALSDAKPPVKCLAESGVVERCCRALEWCSGYPEVSPLAQRRRMASVMAAEAIRGPVLRPTAWRWQCDWSCQYGAASMSCSVMPRVDGSLLGRPPCDDGCNSESCEPV